MEKTEDGDIWVTDDELGFEERIDWTEIAEKVTANPGKWLLAKRRGSRSVVWKINNGVFQTLDVPGFTITATSRNHDGARSDIWVKAEMD